MPTPANLVHEASTTTGTGNFTVSELNGKVRFSDSTYGFGTGGSDVFWYFISNQDAAEWEIGTGSMSDANTLVRDTVIASSNSDALVSFSAGTKDVTNDIIASIQVRLDGNQTFTSPITLPNTGLHLLDTGGNHDYIIAPGEDATADRTLTLDLNDADRTLSLPSPTFTNLTQTGYHDLTEISEPSSPAANVARLYAYDDGGVTKVAYKDNGGLVRDLLRGHTTFADYSPNGDGSTDDEAAVDAFMTAMDGEKSVVTPGTYLASSIVLSGLSGSFHLEGDGRYLAEFKRDSDGVNLVQLDGNDNCQITDLSFDNDYSTNGNSGHGISIADSDYVDIHRVQIRNYGNNGGSAGSGIVAFPNVQSTIRNLSLDHVIVSADDSDSDNTNGVAIVGGRYCCITNSFAEGAIAFGLEYKNDTRYSVLTDSIATDCGYAFGYGQDTVGDDGCDRNVAGNLVSYACDFGLVLGEADNNAFANMVFDTTDAPNRIGDGNFYGARVHDLCDGNLINGMLTIGANMDYPIRIGGDRNSVSLADHSGATNIITFDSGAAKNYVNVLHPGSRTSIASALNDISGNDIDSTDANVVDSPLTREYYGSVSGTFHWKLQDSTASFLSTQSWRYETDGNNILAFASPGATGEIYGFAVNINGTTNYASFAYVKGASAAADYWQGRVGGANQIRLFQGVLRPETDDVFDLGNGSFRYDDIFATNTTIQTSDEREKQQIEVIPDVWLDAWADVEYCRYKWSSAVTEKGKNARWHVGVIAQQVKNAFEKHGIDAFEIGLLCHDDVIDGDGNQIGGRYGIRYTEALALEAALMRRELKRLRDR